MKRTLSIISSFVLVVTMFTMLTTLSVSAEKTTVDLSSGRQLRGFYSEDWTPIDAGMMVDENDVASDTATTIIPFDPTSSYPGFSHTATTTANKKYNLGKNFGCDFYFRAFNSLDTSRADNAQVVFSIHFGTVEFRLKSAGVNRDYNALIVNNGAVVATSRLLDANASTVDVPDVSGNYSISCNNGSYSLVLNGADIDWTLGTAYDSENTVASVPVTADLSNAEISVDLRNNRWGSYRQAYRCINSFALHGCSNGDVNCDRIDADSADMLRIKQALLGVVPADVDKVLNCDVNYTDSVDSSDYLDMKMHILGKKLLKGYTNSPMNIMGIGDSISAATGTLGAWRYKLYENLMDKSDANFRMTGFYTTPDDYRLPEGYQGMSAVGGDTIGRMYFDTNYPGVFESPEQLAKEEQSDSTKHSAFMRLQDYCTADCDIACIMLGTNDWFQWDGYWNKGVNNQWSAKYNPDLYAALDLASPTCLQAYKDAMEAFKTNEYFTNDGFTVGENTYYPLTGMPYSIPTQISYYRQLIKGLHEKNPNMYFYISTEPVYRDSIAYGGKGQDTSMSDVNHINYYLHDYIYAYFKNLGYNIKLVDNLSDATKYKWDEKTSFTAPDNTHPSEAGVDIIGQAFADRMLSSDGIAEDYSTFTSSMMNVESYVDSQGNPLKSVSFSFDELVAHPSSLSITIDDVDATALTLEQGTAKRATPVVLPSNTVVKTVVWTSDDPSVCTVQHNSGLISAVAPGTATVTARTIDGDITASINVTVTAPDAARQDIVLSSSLTNSFRSFSDTAAAKTLDNDGWTNVTASFNTDGKLTESTAPKLSERNFRYSDGSYCNYMFLGKQSGDNTASSSMNTADSFDCTNGFLMSFDYGTSNNHVVGNNYTTDYTISGLTLSVIECGQSFVLKNGDTEIARFIDPLHDLMGARHIVFSCKPNSDGTVNIVVSRDGETLINAANVSAALTASNVAITADSFGRNVYMMNFGLKY